MLQKHSLIFSVFRAQYGSGSAAFFPRGGSAVSLSNESISFLKVRGQLHFEKAGLLCPTQSAEDSTPGLCTHTFGVFIPAYLQFCSFNKTA